MPDPKYTSAGYNMINPEATIQELTPTRQTVSGVTIARLRASRFGGVVMIDGELTLTGTQSDWVVIAKGLPKPLNNVYDLLYTWGSSFKQLGRVRVDSATGWLYIRYAAAGTYNFSMVYPSAE